jgi:hypothetical protein
VVRTLLRGGSFVSGRQYQEFLYIFERTFFAYAFLDDNYEKKAAQILDKYFAESFRCYKDGEFDGTVKPGDVVFDIGAWIGDFAAYAAVIRKFCKEKRDECS